MYVLILRADLHIPHAQSLKARRSAVTPVLRHLDQLAGVGAAEVDHHDKWQRCAIGVSVVGNTVAHAEQTMTTIERYLWSRPDLEVLDLARSWWDADG